MKNNTHGTSWRRARVFIASVLALTISAGGSAALRAESRFQRKERLRFRNSTPSDCGREGSDYAILLTGDLEGCLSGFVEGYTCKELKDYDLYVENGREVFVGRFHGKWGKFRTTYTFDGAYAKGFCQSFDRSLEVGGGCDHKINGGSRVFRDAEGLIESIDVIANVTGDPLTGKFMAGTGETISQGPPDRFDRRRRSRQTSQSPTGIGDPASAGSHFDRCVCPLFQESRQHVAAGEYPAAAASLERAVRIEPANPWLWLELAKVHFASGNLSQAESHARKALSLAGQDVAAQETAEDLLNAIASR